MEYFGRVADKGYRPVIAVGVVACVAAPLAAYWVGADAIPMVIAFAFFAGAISFIAADSVEAGPMPNMAITMLGVVWIGVLGSFAALILAYSNFGEGTPWGTDTLVLVGGIVPQEDISELKAKGVSEVFLPGTSTEDIVKFINQHVRTEN